MLVRVLGLLPVVLLPMLLSQPGHAIPWSIFESSPGKDSGTPKTRKGLRHSPSVIMDVMRSPTSVNSISNPFSWKIMDQLGSFSGGGRSHVRKRPSIAMASMPKPVIKYITHTSPMGGYVVTRVEHKRRPHSHTHTHNHAHTHNVPYKEMAHPWMNLNSATSLNLAPHDPPPSPATMTLQVLPYFVEQSASSPVVMATLPPETEYETSTFYTYVPAGTDAPASFKSPGLETSKKLRSHIRLFSNAHQYRREMQASSKSSTTSTVESPTELVAAAEASNNADVQVDVEATVEEPGPESSWFKNLLGHVIAATELSDQQQQQPKKNQE